MTHREAYPEQYKHPLVGKMVDVVGQHENIVKTGVVERVVSTRFGLLAIFTDDPKSAYGVWACHEIKEGDDAQ